MGGSPWYRHARGTMLEQELFAFLERTSDAAFAVTEQGEIRSWNRSAERLFGYRASEVVNRTCHEALDGRGALGTEVCTGGCSVQACAGGRVRSARLHCRRGSACDNGPETARARLLRSSAMTTRIRPRRCYPKTCGASYHQL